VKAVSEKPDETAALSAVHEQQCELAVVALCQAAATAQLPEHIGFHISTFIVAQSGQMHLKGGGNAPPDIVIKVLEKQITALQEFLEVQKAEALKKLD